MKVKISEAKGQVLDYLVAQAMGMKIYRSKSGRWMTANYGEFNHRHGTPWLVPTQEVWFVSGCEEGYLFETKLDAEIYARKIFPDMSEDNRYARVYFKTVYEFKEG
jgi:hypothetical protein